MKVTSKEEALAIQRENAQRRKERLSEFIEMQIAEWTQWQSGGPIEFELDTRGEREAAQEVLQFYVDAGWSVTTDSEYGRIMMH